MVDTITTTPTLERYKTSFCLFVYRMLDMARVAPSDEIKQVLINESKFLYGLMCSLKYNDSKSAEIDALIKWGVNLGTDIKLDQYKDMYVQKLTELRLLEMIPTRFVFSFSTIWDSIHLMCYIADVIVLNRHKYTYEHVSVCISNFKWVFYNMFIILFCPVCAKHYLTVDTFPFEFEQVQVALFKESLGEPLVLVNEINRNQAQKNILHKYHLLYKSMLFHNHINNYRPIQHKNNQLNDFQRMDWNLYTTLLNIA
ncbi:P33 [Epinotia aporema granulovirus]|uniref:p33 n=1 Tax=Epinotia aporema granulovirus TaxID=166056 RepID=K4ER67_9BBAC|nr:P33 [Epinotia aporema granulovirus]AER41514.1 P33 [Epinotia aporema granulovirus]